MVSIRPFKSGDNDALLNMEKLCPQGDESSAWGADDGPDITNRYKIYDNWNLIIAEDAGKVVGSIGSTLKETGDGRTYVYLTEVNVTPDFQNKGIASELVGEVEKEAKDVGADHVYCYIFETNKGSIDLFEHHGYEKVKEVKSCGLSTYKEQELDERFSIEVVQEKDIPNVVNLINDYYYHYEHFKPYTSESFKDHLNSIPGYGMENFWVLKKDDELTACAGLWDFSSLSKLYISKERTKMKIMGGIFRFISNFRAMPYIPPEGEYFKLNHIVDHAFKTGNSDAVLNLLVHLNNVLVNSGKDAMVINLDPKDIIMNTVNGMHPIIENWSLFIKKFKEKEEEFGRIYVDMRDMLI